MPRLSIDYTNTIIYKIQHTDKEELIYVGYTTDFTKRKSAHNESRAVRKTKHTTETYVK
jgi:predicted GIY-YIG superfamily endonuclease